MQPIFNTEFINILAYLYAWLQHVDALLKEAFLIGLKNDGYKTIDEYKDYLRGFSDADLIHDVIELREDRDQEDDWSNHPDITPEQSFRRMVACYENIINIDIHNEVIEEMQ